MEELLARPNSDGKLEIDPLEVNEGERSENVERHENGKTLFSNGDMYVGQYRNGFRHGEGTYVFKNGARYNGDWRHGQKYGQGTFWYPDGTRYEGEWRRNAKHGFGTYCYMNNDIYEGSWKEDLRHGIGTYLYADTGTKYIGTWMEDRMQGPGQLIHARYQFHGFWKMNLETDNDVEKGTLKEESSPKMGFLLMWRARCITPYNPELLPPETVFLREEVSTESSLIKDEDDVRPKIEGSSDYLEDYHEEHYQEKELSSQIDSL